MNNRHRPDTLSFEGSVFPPTSSTFFPQETCMKICCLYNNSFLSITCCMKSNYNISDPSAKNYKHKDNMNTVTLGARIRKEMQ